MHQLIPMSLLTTVLICTATASAAKDQLETHPIQHVTKGTQLNKKTVRNIFLGKMKSWNDGQRLVVASLKKGTTHTQFLKEWVGMTPSQFRTHWRKRVFTGTGTMPTWLKTEEQQKTFVIQTPGAIGYQRKSHKQSLRKGPAYFDPKTARYVRFERVKKRS